MLAVLYSEILKLRRSLVLLLIILAPLCLGAFAGMFAVMAKGGVPWLRFVEETVGAWSYFLLPLTLTALALLLAQIEHTPRMWTYLLALPVARGKLFATKAIVIIGLLIVLQTLVFGIIIGVGMAVDALWSGDQLIGAIPVRHLATSLIAMTGGAVLLIVIQLWVSLRFKSFVPPLLVGIAGTFFGLFITASRREIYLPWLLQTYALHWPSPEAQNAIWIGLVGGLLALGAMTFDLSRRDAR